MDHAAPMEAAPGGSAPDGSALCTRCGLCCDGLFGRLRIEPEEVALARRAGSTVEQREDGLYASLPCSLVDGAVCTVYADRYAACRRFRCKLLGGFMRREIEIHGALAHVAEMRCHLAAMRAATAAAGWSRPDDGSRGRAARWRDLPDGAERQTMVKAELSVVAYNFYADRHFRNVPDPAGRR